MPSKRKPIGNSSITEDEMIEALGRSGYLIEGRVIRALTRMGMFVQPGQAYYDEETGKSREVDAVAEANNWNTSASAKKIAVLTTLVVEIISNLYPVVLLTPRTGTPNDSFYDYLPFASTPEDGEEHPIFSTETHEELFGIWDWKQFSQYCSFTRKRAGDELMAFHPDDLYGSIDKAARFAFQLRDQNAEWTKNSEDDYWRILNWEPVIVLQGGLYVLNENPEGNKLVPAPTGKLEFNFHHRRQSKSVAINFVTEAALENFCRGIIMRDTAVGNHIASQRHDLE